MVSPRSPRATVAAFFGEARAGNYEQAARYLDLPKTLSAQGPTVAFRVQTVLDRKLWIDVESLSPAPQGNLDDGLPPRMEEVGRIARARYASLPIRLVRTNEAALDGFRFSRATVEELNALYEAVPDRFVLERVPPALRRIGPLELMWWQWLGLPALALVCALLGLGLSWMTRRLLGRFADRTETRWDDALLARARGPLTLFWAIGVGYVTLFYLALSVAARAHLETFLKTGAVVALFWSALRSIDLTADVLAESPPLRGRSARALLPVVTRIAKISVFGMLVVAVLSSVGLPVASLLAGLGVGGVALALAAQKTVENVFGAVSIGVDVPFQVGDYIKVGELLGTVEAIGLRSTRLRTLDRTLVTIPNGGLSDARIESYTARDRIRLALTIGIEYSTREAQMRKILEEVEARLRAHPHIWPDKVIVRLARFGASALEIDVMAWFLTQDWNEFQDFRQEILLDFMRIVEAHQASFAFPTQTVHLKHGPPPIAASRPLETDERSHALAPVSVAGARSADDHATHE